MINVLAVAIGGAVGSVLRYGVARALASASYPWATQSVNVLGSFLIGLAFVLLAHRYGSHHPAYQLVIVGLLGGFTTYSSFSMDALRLLEQGRTGTALAYVASTVALCLAAAALGLMLGRRLV